MPDFTQPYEIVRQTSQAIGSETQASSNRIVCERVYFDSATILRQLGLILDLAVAS